MRDTNASMMARLSGHRWFNPSDLLHPFLLLEFAAHPSNSRRKFDPHQYSMPLNCFLTRPLRPRQFYLLTWFWNRHSVKSRWRCLRVPSGNLMFDFVRSGGNFLIYTGLCCSNTWSIIMLVIYLRFGYYTNRGHCCSWNCNAKRYEMDTFVDLFFLRI